MQPNTSSAENNAAKPLALPASTRAKLSALSFLFQESDSKTMERAIEALVQSLPKPDQELVDTLEAKVLERHGCLSHHAGKRLAQQIRDFADENYIRPARDRGEQSLTIEVKEVHRQLGLHQRYAAVISALQGRAFLKAANVELVDSAQSPDGSARILAYRIL